MIFTHNIDPVILSMGPVQMRWYGLMYVLGFIAAFFQLRRLSKEGLLQINYEQIDTLLFYTFVGLFIGARIFYVFVYNFGYYSQHPLEMLAFWKGGLSFHGALLGFAAAFWVFSKKYNISFWAIADSCGLVVPVGLGFGRLGNFINGELFGRATDGTWGVVFAGGGPMPRHPSQLYEAFFEGAVIWTLLNALRFKFRQGQIIGLFLILYGVFRFGIEYFRQPDAQLGFVFLSFSMGQILCSLMMIAGASIWFLRAKAPARQA
jgi:phosphatidylglycerol---prolipoprotein diacylglyceryl transferase